MFEKLRGKLNIGIVAVTLLFALLSSGVCYGVIVRNAFVMQAARVKQNAENGTNVCKAYIEAVQDFSRGVTDRQEIAEKISAGIFDSEIKQLINDFKLAVDVAGVTLYGVNDYVTYSAEMGDIKSFEEFLQNKEISDFWNGNEEDFISVRNTVVAGVYGNTIYDGKRGIISCMSKVCDVDGNAVGLLVADILPSALSESKLAYDGFDLPCKSFFTDGVAVYGGNKELALYAKENARSVDGKYYVVSADFVGDSKVVMVARLTAYKEYCVKLAVAMLAVLCLIAFGVIAFAKYVAHCVTEPLCQLLAQMASDEKKLTSMSKMSK